MCRFIKICMVLLIYVVREADYMKPRIFVSSTFYDLKYVREELSNFVKAHDFEPVMFEDGDIGYYPDQNLDESCYDAMRTADMVILIIGGNYGSRASDQENDDFDEYISITRKEFKTAVNSNIPVFAFVDSKVNAEYDIYDMNIKNIENNKGYIKFKSTKDINVFRFIKEIYSIKNISITSFSKINEIKDFLSKQWSDMFKTYLQNLKNEKQIAEIQSALEDMQMIVKKIDLMIGVVGKKVFEDEPKEYDKIILMQQDIESEKICREIIDNITFIALDENKKVSKKEISELLKLYVDFSERQYIEKNKINKDSFILDEINEHAKIIGFVVGYYRERAGQYLVEYLSYKNNFNVVVDKLSRPPFFNFFISKEQMYIRYK